MEKVNMSNLPAERVNSFSPQPTSPLDNDINSPTTPIEIPEQTTKKPKHKTESSATTSILENIVMDIIDQPSTDPFPKQNKKKDTHNNQESTSLINELMNDVNNDNNNDNEIELKTDIIKVGMKSDSNFVKSKTSDDGIIVQLKDGSTLKNRKPGTLKRQHSKMNNDNFEQTHHFVKSQQLFLKDFDLELGIEDEDTICKRFCKCCGAYCCMADACSLNRVVSIWTTFEAGGSVLYKDPITTRFLQIRIIFFFIHLILFIINCISVPKWDDWIFELEMFEVNVIYFIYIIISVFLTNRVWKYTPKKQERRAQNVSPENRKSFDVTIAKTKNARGRSPFSLKDMGYKWLYNYCLLALNICVPLSAIVSLSYWFRFAFDDQPNIIHYHDITLMVIFPILVIIEYILSLWQLRMKWALLIIPIMDVLFVGHVVAFKKVVRGKTYTIYDVYNSNVGLIPFFDSSSFIIGIPLYIVSHLIISLLIVYYKNVHIIHWWRAHGINDHEHMLHKNESNPLENTNNETIKIAFGSCIHQRFDKMPAVKAIQEENPDMFLLLGDNIYVDSSPAQVGMCGCFCMCCKTLYDAPKEYEKLLKHPDIPLIDLYGDTTNNTKDLIIGNNDDENSTENNEEHESSVVINENKNEDDINDENEKNKGTTWLAIWDDHDYGGNNFDATWKHKIVYKKYFLDFFDQINQHNQLQTYKDQMTNDPTRGVYYHYDKLHKIKNGEKIWIRVYMFDVRYHRLESDTLGLQQWEWFENLLKNMSNEEKKMGQKIDWHLLCYGTGVFLEHPDFAIKAGAETCARSTAKKIVGLLKDANIMKKSLILSGDVHYSVVHKHEDLWEFTISALTHSLHWWTLERCFLRKAEDYEYSERKSVICLVDGYGYLEMTKDKWFFCLKDGWGNIRIPVTSDSKHDGFVPEIVHNDDV